MIIKRVTLIHISNIFSSLGFKIIKFPIQKPITYRLTIGHSTINNPIDSIDHPAILDVFGYRVQFLQVMDSRVVTMSSILNTVVDSVVRHDSVDFLRESRLLDELYVLFDHSVEIILHWACVGVTIHLKNNVILKEAVPK